MTPEGLTVELSPELRASHAELSHLDIEFREFASKDPECLQRETFRELEAPHRLLRYQRQSWPSFMARGRVEELARISVMLSRLLRGVPERIFGNDPERIGAYFDVDPFFVELLLEPPSGIETGMSRGDLISTASGFKCVEFNMTSCLGGWETGVLAEILLRVPVIRRFLEGVGAEVAYRDTARQMLECVIRDVRKAGLATGGEINVAVGMREAPEVLEDPVLQGFLQRVHTAALREVDPALTGWAGAVDYGLVRQVDASLSYRGNVLHAFIERHALPSDERVFRGFKTGQVKLYNGPIALILSDKRNLAALSEHATDSVFEAEEKSFVAEYLPWTRRLERGELEYRGDSVLIPDFLFEERTRCVIKKARSVGGRDVVVGRYTDEEEWARRVESALTDGDWLVQEYLESQPYLYQAGEEGCSTHDVIWGPFVLGTTYAGTILRMQPKEAGGIVNLTQEATEGIILEVED